MDFEGPKNSANTTISMWLSHLRVKLHRWHCHRYWFDVVWQQVDFYGDVWHEIAMTNVGNRFWQATFLNEICKLSSLQTLYQQHLSSLGAFRYFRAYFASCMMNSFQNLVEIKIQGAGCTKIIAKPDIAALDCL